MNIVTYFEFGKFVELRPVDNINEYLSEIFRFSERVDDIVNRWNRKKAHLFVEKN